nr:unnamed protein product [Spirometra erinaceieuropaei]
MGCSEFYLSDDRIVPLSLKEVHLEFCLEPIISRSDEEPRRSDIEEILLKAGVGSSHLQCSLTSTDMPRMDMLSQDFGTVVRLKFLPLLTCQKNTLVSLDISTELLVGCLKDQQAVRQIVSLRGQLPCVRRLFANSGRVLGSELFRAVTVTAADLRPFLEMLPSLSYLEVDRAYRIRGLEVDDLCRVCPCLKTLVCYSLGHADVWVARKSSPWRLETLHWLLDDEFTAEHLSALADCVEASYILLYLNRSETALEREQVEAVFARMPCLRWLVLVWETRSLTWICSEVPQDFKDATIVHLYKRKGNRQVCDNHRGISLLNIAGKIFARTMLDRLNIHLEQGLLPESQCGFRRHRGTTDMIFAARQLQEKCQEMRTHLYSTFVDLTKAFDTVNREGLWKIMQKFGCPERFTQMVRQLHDGMMARVTDNGAVSEAFAVTNGAKQGCVLAPTLFSLMFSAMLMDAYRDERPGIRIAYRTDGHLLNQRRMNFQSRVSTTTVHELLFTDDCALNTTSEAEMQRSMDLFSAACENFGLVINTQKKVVMHQPPPNSATAPNAPRKSA